MPNAHSLFESLTSARPDTRFSFEEVTRPRAAAAASFFAPADNSRNNYFSPPLHFFPRARERKRADLSRVRNIEAAIIYFNFGCKAQSQRAAYIFSKWESMYACASRWFFLLIYKFHTVLGVRAQPEEVKTDCDFDISDGEQCPRVCYEIIRIDNCRITAVLLL